MRLIDMSFIYLKTIVYKIYIFIIVLYNDIIPKNLNILSDDQLACYQGFLWQIGPRQDVSE